MAEFSQFQDCEVAIKFEKKRSRLFGDRDYLQNEMHTLMRICRHPNVITLLGYTMSSMTAAGDHQRQQLGLVMELMHSDLRSYIDQTKLHLRKGITTSLTAGNQFLAIARQVAAGMVSTFYFLIEKRCYQFLTFPLVEENFLDFISFFIIHERIVLRPVLAS